jgi:hypothetical protein
MVSDKPKLNHMLESHNYDYIYEPYNITLKHHYKPSSLIFENFCNINNNNKMLSHCKKIQDYFGINRTVYGIKKVGNEYSFEFYYYYPNKYQNNSFDNILKFNNIPISKIPEDSYLTAFSLDTNCALKSVNVYYAANNCDHIKKRKYNGYMICTDCLETESYKYDNENIKKENLYKFFYIMNNECKKAYDYLNSLHNSNCGPSLSDQIFKVPCKKSICVTIKPDSIGLYFSQVEINSFIYALSFFEYPQKFINYIITNKDNYEHLLFDIGYNFKIDNDKIIYTKSSFYGIF